MSLLSGSMEDISCYEPPKSSSEVKATTKNDNTQNKTANNTANKGQVKNDSINVRQEVLMKLLSNDAIRGVFQDTNVPLLSDFKLKSDIIPYVDKGLECLTEITKRNASHTNLVREFTVQSMGVKLPNKPTKMSKDEVKFIVRMVLSEMLELCATVTPNVEEAHNLFGDCCIEVDKPRAFEPETKSDVEIMAEQYDSFVDAWYYMLNTAVKKGVDLDGIFRIVHGANMAKRFPDGTFHRREDGKVVKPDGWKEPDIVGEIKRQMDS